MNLNQVTDGVIEVIAMNSRFTKDEIEQNKPLDKYISSDMKARLAREVKGKFQKVKTIKLTNELFVTIKKVKDLIQHVYQVYNEV
ncbi:hypothetical protein [Pseudochryseolinea flava]|uniref:Uncharacterized protein n=1 Tax=Pseudochryseolinea flava TaxID=2059302 RepID=A0A364XWW9_9BACT|nr:hypothetical protein [Pseudochryseolinea flava]RAV98880.1 hypothetical protein DQQ10_21500 [Pseudochryseolinea flava]